MKSASLAFCLLIQLTLFGQINTAQLNQTNSKGEKHGYWKVFVDSALNEVEKDKAYYYYYYYYHNGLRIFGLERDMTRGKKVILNVEGNKYVENEITILNGTYIQRLKKEPEKSSVLRYNKGILEYNLVSWDNSGYYYESKDYTKKYKNMVSSYYYESQVNKNKIKKGYCYFLPNSRKMKCDLKKYKIEQ